jgi:hypothetical protein
MFVSPQKLGSTLHYTATKRAVPNVEPLSRTLQIYTIYMQFMVY